ncbi:sperm acrosome membrane-associated protein 6 [Apus apus]|uniref:sperm acrosome membrane-associated protein 6 n=1 Tax=Apus apus TaxID=8895 RepID=UPI0021F84CE9|nr:sperm acrosome membrane-associated protein 6 [Apus apus]
MGWWWVPLVLVLAPWLPGSPGIQAGQLCLWQWVALVSWLPGVHPCLLCFETSTQQEQLCHNITGAPVKDPQHQQCLDAIAEAAAPLTSVTVGSEQREALQEIIMDALHFLENQNNTKPFEESLQEAISIIWVNLSQLEEAPACIPPCGYQKAARTFQCATCRVVDCQFPVDCPAQDLWAHADEAITLDCSVPFVIPPDLPITWMFAKDLHTQDLSVFEELRGILGDPLSLTLHDPTPGTIACCLGFLSEPLARKYFYLNVTGGSVEAERGIQERFQAVLRWPHHRIPPDYLKPLVLALALGSMALVVLLV